MWNDAIWKNGRKTLRGRWRYYWAGDYFIIHIDGKDNVTGRSREPFLCYNDSPEWGKWKLQRKKKEKIV